MTRPHQRWNYAAHITDGGFYGGSQAFLNANTVLPAAILALGGPSWLIALMPVAMLTGMSIPPLFVAHRIDQLPRFRPLLLVAGVIQRLPYLIAGIVLVRGMGGRTCMLAVIAGVPLLSGLVCGVGLTAWQQLFADTLPPHRRSSALAGRNLIASLIGLFAGWVVKATLEAYPGPAGYGRLHLYSFAMLCVSFTFFAMVRESVGDGHTHTQHRRLMDNLKSLPTLLRNTPGLAVYLPIAALTSGIFVVAPFLVVHLKQGLGKPDSWVGQAVAAQMFGGVVGNLMAAWVGDRRGGKSVLIISQIAVIASLLPALLHPSNVTAMLSFAAFGVAYSARHVGTTTVTLDLVPRQQRATALSCIGIVGLLSMLCASALGALLFGSRQSFLAPAVASIGLAAATLFTLALLPEPRITEQHT